MKQQLARFLLFIILHAITGSAALYYDIVLYTVLGMLSLWILFIPTGLILTAHRKQALTGWRLALAKLWGYVFVLIDVLVNYGPMSYVFLQLPDNERKTVTARLKHYLRTEPFSWRGKVSLFMCVYLIEPWDAPHCALNK